MKLPKVGLLRFATERSLHCDRSKLCTIIFAIIVPYHASKSKTFTSMANIQYSIKPVIHIQYQLRYVTSKQIQEQRPRQTTKHVISKATTTSGGEWSGGGEGLQYQRTTANGNADKFYSSA